jgi:hypothetical protein
MSLAPCGNPDACEEATPGASFGSARTFYGTANPSSNSAVQPHEIAIPRSLSGRTRPSWDVGSCGEILSLIGVLLFVIAGHP